MATTSAQVQQLYVAYLGRAADKAGLDYWLNELNADKATLTLDDLRSNFVNEQPEYANAYAGLSRQDTVIKIYNNLFGRAPDAAGLSYWTNGGGSTVNADQLLTAFVNGAATADATVLANKVLVAEVYTSAAGDNYTKADATSIIADVNGSAGSVGIALGHLEDGSLPGVAIPAGIAAVKAVAIAEKAVTDLETAQITTLSDLNKAVIALNVKAGAPVEDDLTITGTGTAGAVTYNDAVAAVAHAQTLRADISESTTATLQANVTNANAAFTTARDAFTKANVGNVDLTVKFEAAFTANEGLKAADANALTVAEGKIAVDFTTANTGHALADANTAAGLTGVAAVTNTATLYAALTNPASTPAQIKAVSDAFGTFLGTTGAADYTALKALATTDYAKNVAELNLDNAVNAVNAKAGGNSYLSAYEIKADATETLANATAADALVSQAGALTAAHTAAEDAAGSVTVPAFAHNLDAAGNITDPLVTAGVDGKADLFYFSAIKATDDLALTNFNKGDALYIGEGYTFNSAVKVGTDGFVTGTNTSAKEVYFTQATDGTVSVNIETNAIGHTAGSGNADNVAVITLTGVTSLSDVSFANGVVSSTHAEAVA